MANEAKIIITADPSGAITGLKAVGDEAEKLQYRTQTVISKIKGHWLALTAITAGAAVAMNKAWDLAEMAAQFEEQKRALNFLAAQYDTTASSIIESIRTASKGLISMADAASIAGEAMAKGLRPEQVIKLSSAAATLADISGNKVAVEFRNLSEAIALGRERTLEATVGIIDLNAKFGDQVNKMTDAEKAAARYNIVMEKVENIQKILGESTDSINDKMERLTVTVQNIRLHLGTALIRGALGVAGAFQGLAAGALTAAGGIFKLLSAIEWMTDKLGLTNNATKKFGEMADAAFGAAGELSGKAVENFKAMITSTENLSKAMGKIKIAPIETAVIKKEDEKIAKERLRLQQDLDDRLRLLNTEMHLRELEALKIRHEKEISEFNRLGIDTTKLKQAHLLEIRELEDKHRKEQLDREKKIQEERLQLDQDLDDRLRLLKTEADKRDLEALKIKHEKEIAEYERLNMDITKLKQAHLLEIQEIEEKYRKEQQDRDIKAQEERLRLEQDLADRLRILKTEADKRDLEALKIKHEKEIAEFERLGMDITSLKEAHLLEIQALEDKFRKDKEEKDRLALKSMFETMLELQAKEQAYMIEGYDNMWRSIFDITNQAGDEIGKAIGMIAAGLKGITDITIEKDIYSQRLVELKEFLAQKAELFYAGIISEIEYNDYAQQTLLEMDRQTSQQRLAIAQHTVGMLTGLMYSLYIATGKQSEELFKLYKAFAIAETVITTIKAAQDAYAWGWKYGGPAAPYLSAAMAAIAITAGMARVAMIAAQKPGTVSAVSPAGGGGYAYTAPAAPAEPAWRKEEEQPRSQIVNVYIYGHVVDHDKFAREMIPAITKAVGDGAQ